MKTRIIVIVSILITAIMMNCSGSHQGGENGDHKAEPIAVTVWTDEMEMFTEYAPPVTDEPVTFTIHLTRLADFTPVRSGKVIMKFAGTGGSPAVINEFPDLLREGIFSPEISFPEPGSYNVSVTYIGDGLNNTFDLGVVSVGSGHEKIHHEVETEGDEISFLKEQQWKTEFMTGKAELKKIRPSIETVGEIIPRQQDHVSVTAPLAGVLDPSVNRYMAAPGSYVKKGDVIALLAPQAGAGESWQQIKLALDQAEDRFKRAERLMDSGAISRREYEDLRREYLLLKAGFPDNSEGKSRYFSVTSPISGEIETLKALPGSYLQKGETILHVTNSEVLWLRLNVYETDLGKISEPAGADIRTTGSDKTIAVASGDLELLSKRGRFDPRTGSIPFIFEMKNREMKLKIGQMVMVRLYTSEEIEALCVPVPAVYNDEGRQVIFVQTGGESFEKRAVKTGAVYRGYIEILSGLKAGEHIVTSGGYFIKLAGTSTPIGHGHTH